MSEYRQLELTDLQIQSCARWRDPSGREYLELFHAEPFIRTIPALNLLPDFELGIRAEFDFLVKAIGYVGLPATGLKTQIQWPDGRFLQSTGIDLSRFLRTGKRGRLVDPPELCEANQKIRITLDNTANDATTEIELYFEGVLRVPLIEGKGSNGRLCILG